MQRSVVAMGKKLESAHGGWRYVSKRKTMLSMIYKMGMSAEKSWKRLRGFRQLGKVIEGVKFRNGEEEMRKLTLSRKCWEFTV